MIDTLSPERRFSPDGIATGDHSCASFDDLLARVRTRLGVLLGALGTSASDEQIEQAVLDVTLDVARFTLAWAEGDAAEAVPHFSANLPRGILRDKAIHGQRDR